MIQIDFKGLQIIGKKSLVKAELSTIVHFLYTDELLSKNEIKECIEYAFKDEKEINKDLKDLINKIKKKIK